MGKESWLEKRARKAVEKAAGGEDDDAPIRVIVEAEIDGKYWTISGSPKAEQDLDDFVEDMDKALEKVIPAAAVAVAAAPVAPPGWYYPPGSLIPAPLPVVAPASDTPTTPALPPQ